MPAEVLYRKWRPQRFAEVAGQDAVTRTLINALAGHKVSHAYLFAGPRGTGKTTTARLLAKAINCEKNAPEATDSPGEPCNECASCTSFGSDASLDLIEMDGASNRGIEDIRSLREATNYMPMAGVDAHKVYLIDEVHMLTDPAFNALLKTLEEPPPHVIFILATTDEHKVPATIVSRCQRHQFKRIAVSAIVDRLAYIAEQESIAVPREGLDLVARDATGSLRDAINLLEQICDSYGKDASLEAVREGLGLIVDERAAQLASQALSGDLAGGLATIASVRDDGLDLRQFQKEVVLRLRQLLFVQTGAAAEGGWTAEQLAEMRSATEGVAREKLVKTLRAFGQADLRADPLSPLPLELALADAIVEPAPAAARDSAPARATAAPPIRGGQQRPAPPRPQPPQRAPASPQTAPAPRQQVPADLRKDLSKASAEDIAAMLGSSAPVIPPASDAPPASNGSATPAAAAQPPGTNGGELADLVARLYTQMKPVEKKIAPFINGSCHAVSFEGGVLTLGFYAPFHKGKVEEYRSTFEQSAAQLLGEAVTIRCIMTERPAPKAAKSALVQHAVENHGAKIVSRNQES